jgi:predicted nucleic acid-binding protein
MQAVFADSFYFFALVNSNDPAHIKAVAVSRDYTGRLVTSAFVLVEFADGCATLPHRRAIVAQAVDELCNNSNVVVHPCTDQLFQAGWRLYQQRPDKEWSLTDCISFVVMQREGITEALTGDRHFEQAGFSVLLR